MNAQYVSTFKGAVNDVQKYDEIRCGGVVFKRGNIASMPIVS
jgi:hypothetical protein